MIVSYNLLRDVPGLLRKLVDTLSHNVTFQDNIRCVVIDIADSGTANTEFTVNHGLGQTPIGYIANIDQSGNVYDSSKSTWNSNTLTIKCTASNAVLRLVVF